MRALHAESEAHGLARCEVGVWDTQHVPPSDAFDFYRGAVCEVYTRWSPEFEGEAEFRARIETIKVKGGSISRHRCTPHVAVRTLADIANSPGEYHYLSLILGGGSECQQHGRTSVLKAGDIAVLDSAWPAKFRMAPEPFDALVVTIPKADLPATDAEERLGNVNLKQNRTPLAGCLSLVADRMLGASREELNQLYDACLSLLPLEAGCFDTDNGEAAASAQPHYLLREIMKYLDQNVTEVGLDPHRVAAQFGISVRYIHKLFIACGVTFSAYLTARRLGLRQQRLALAGVPATADLDGGVPLGLQRAVELQPRLQAEYGCTPSQFRSYAGD